MDDTRVQEPERERDPFCTKPRPRVYALPEEPPVGTVVAGGGRLWRRHEDSWYMLGADGVADCQVTWVEVLTDGDGQVVEVVPTPAQRMAVRLVEVAAHLRAHPDLPVPTGISSGDLVMDYDDGVSLLAWVRSMTDVGPIEPDPDSRYRRVAGRLVGGSVVQLSAWLDQEPSGPITVDQLEEFVAARSIGDGA